MAQRVHVDTDFAGDPDDACALALLLGTTEAEVVGVTTALEDRGRRHDCLRWFLDLCGRTDVASAAGHERTLTGREFTCTWADPRHWPTRPPPSRQASPEAALDLLATSIENDATVLAIGGFTNLAALELTRPGSLSGARIVAMGGWIVDSPAGWPQWGAAGDFNTQCDTVAARLVASTTASLTLVTVPTAMQASLRSEHLDRLSATGPVGELLARQSARHRETNDFDALVASHPALPMDLVNFHWDPVAAAVALGWDCVTTKRTALTTTLDDGVLAFEAVGADGTDAVTTSTDAGDFEERWMQCIKRLSRPSA